jgi:hypothetical protein
MKKPQPANKKPRSQLLQEAKNTHMSCPGSELAMTAKILSLSALTLMCCIAGSDLHVSA